MGFHKIDEQIQENRILFVCLKLKTIFFILLCFNVLIIEAKDVYYTQYNNQNGLANNKVFNIYQNKKGFIWLGTEAGLIRFDNHSFKKYNAINQSSLSVSNIKEDHLGRIWFMNFDGFVYYIENDVVKSIENKPTNSYQPFALTNTKLYIFQLDGIHVFDIKTLKRIKIINCETIRIESSIVNINEEIFFIQNQELYKVNANYQIIKAKNSAKFNHNNAKLTTFNNRIFWASQFNSEKVIYEYSINLEYINTHSINDVEGINEIDFIKNQLWISTNKGCFYYDFDGVNLVFKENILKDKAVSKSIKDYQNNYWYSTLDNGILQVADLSINKINIESSYPNVFIYQNNQYLIGTKKGELYFMNENEKSALKQFKGNPIIYFLKGFANGDIFASGFGSYWITNNIETQYNFGFAIKDVCQIDNKYYGIATNGQLLLLKKNDVQSTSIWDNHIAIHSNNKENPNQLFELDLNIRIKCVAYDSILSTIYYSGNSGLKYKTLTETGYIKLNNKQNIYASSMFVYNQKLFALSADGILYSIQKEKKEFVFSNLNNKILQDNHFIKMVKKRHNDLFILSNVGFFKMNLNTLKTSKIPVYINENEVIDFCLKNDSIVSFLTDKYIIEKHINQPVISSTKSTNFEILSFKSNGLLIDRLKINEFKFNENNIEIEFAHLNFNNADLKSTFYQVNNGDWIKINSDLNTLSFQNLNEGNYEIRFKIEGQIISQFVKFKILPPFYRTWWFYLIIVLLLVLTVYIVYYFRLKRIKKDVQMMSEKMKLEKELNNSIVTSIKSQMNPHFFYNALNTIQSFLYTDKKREASNYLSKFSDLTRTILEMSDKETIKLSEEIEAIKLYLELEKMRFEDDFIYEISIHSNVELDFL